ncbi:MAG: VOC family protein [Candidatus Melainabacteria bacterium]|nr:VOC family protein [Candidatus Melainabacteria bacterium]
MSFKPDGYTEITPYLTVKDAHKLLHFLVSVFDAQAIRKVEELDGTLKHAAVKIGEAVLEMSEATEEYPPAPAALHIYVEDIDATHDKAVEAGCTVLTEPADMDYGERSSGVLDPFGNKWYIATFKR